MNVTSGSDAPNSLPEHRSSGWILAGAICCVLASAGLILMHAVRLVGVCHTSDLWLLLVVLAAWPAADFASGIVHWLGDTWGTEQWPFLGPRFIRPFRVHHVNPQGMLASSFFDSLLGLTRRVVLPAPSVPLPEATPATPAAIAEQPAPHESQSAIRKRLHRPGESRIMKAR